MFSQNIYSQLTRSAKRLYQSIREKIEQFDACNMSAAGNMAEPKQWRTTLSILIGLSRMTNSHRLGK